MDIINKKFVVKNSNEKAVLKTFVITAPTETAAAEIAADMNGSFYHWEKYTVAMVENQNIAAIEKQVDSEQDAAIEKTIGSSTVEAIQSSIQIADKGLTLLAIMSSSATTLAILMLILMTK